jgi:hypothetical protein
MAAQSSLMLSNSNFLSPFAKIPASDLPRLLRTTLLGVGEDRFMILNISFLMYIWWADAPSASNPVTKRARSAVNVRRYSSCCSEGRLCSFLTSNSGFVEDAPFVEADAELSAMVVISHLAQMMIRFCSYNA